MITRATFLGTGIPILGGTKWQTTFDAPEWDISSPDGDVILARGAERYVVCNTPVVLTVRTPTIPVIPVPPPEPQSEPMTLMRRKSGRGR